MDRLYSASSQAVAAAPRVEPAPGAEPVLSQRAEWRRHWPLVLAALMGFSLYSLIPYSFGLFMEPIGAEFGWGRAEISFAMMIPSIFLILLSPSVGALIDRWGSRTIAIPGVVLTALAIAALGLANGSRMQWLSLWLIFGMVTQGVATTIWTSTVSGAFLASRGLALGITLCGMAVAQIVAPPLAQWLIAAFGWREALQWMALAWGLPSLVLVVLFFRDVTPRSRRGAIAPHADEDNGLPGLSLRQAMRNPAMQKLALSTLITMMIGMAVLIHQVPILTAAGTTRENAAWLASLAGAAGLLGKVNTGWMTDRWNASVVGAISLFAPALGYIVLMQPEISVAAMVASMMVIGYAAGTKMQICAFLTARYAGMRNYGKIFGIMASIIGVGGGLGTLAAGLVYDLSGSYQPLLLAGIVGSVASALLVLKLGPAPTEFPRSA